VTVNDETETVMLVNTFVGVVGVPSPPPPPHATSAIESAPQIAERRETGMDIM
jgi:hypothetical protein